MKDEGRRKEDRTEGTGRRTEYTKDEVWNTKDEGRMEDGGEEAGRRLEGRGWRTKGTTAVEGKGQRTVPEDEGSNET